MGTSRLSSSPTTVANSAQTQPIQSPFQVSNVPGVLTAQLNTPDGILYLWFYTPRFVFSGKIAALGALVKLSQNHGYLIYQHEDPILSKKGITIKEGSGSGKFEITKIDDELPDLRTQRIYVQVHHNPPQRLMIEHLLDYLSESSLGRNNLELKKNVTIDFFDSDADWGVRDNAGFIVTDKLQLHQISVDSDELLKVLKPSKGMFSFRFFKFRPFLCIINPCLNTGFIIDYIFPQFQRILFLSIFSAFRSMKRKVSSRIKDCPW